MRLRLPAHWQTGAMPLGKERMTPQQAKEWIEHAPADPGVIANGLVGWLDPESTPMNVFCSTCAGRLAGRGIMLPKNWIPVWSDSFMLQHGKHCACCGAWLGKPVHAYPKGRWTTT
jgi:hypothetical protein